MTDCSTGSRALEDSSNVAKYPAAFKHQSPETFTTTTDQLTADRLSSNHETGATTSREASVNTTTKTTPLSGASTVSEVNDQEDTGSLTNTESTGSSQAIEQPAEDTEAANDQAKGEKRVPQPCLYKVGRELGKGTYSVVKEAIHVETNKYFAAKVINKRLMRGREHLVRNEIVVLKRLSRGHPNILTLVDYFETDNNLYLITELAKGGELFDRIYTKGSFYESDASRIVREITGGVAYLHSHGIVHRDLKPENLLFKTNGETSRLLIADFGLSRIVDEERLKLLMTTCGTPSYMAPEIFTKAGHAKPVDIWAIGVITYFLLSGYTPFDRETPAEEREAILKGEFRFEPEEYWIHVSGDALRFIQSCLHNDPKQRMTVEQCLQHPFLTKKYRRESDLLPEMEKLALERERNSTSNYPSTLEGRAMQGLYSMSPST